MWHLLMNWRIFFIICLFLLANTSFQYIFFPQSLKAGELKTKIHHNPADDTRIQVIFDQTKDQISSPFDTGFDGLSRLALLLRSHGAVVSINNLPLKSVLPTVHGRGNILVLGIPWNIGYTSDDIKAINAFLDSGGGVLTIVEHDNIYRNCDIQNPLIEPFGIKAIASQSNGRHSSNRDELLNTKNYYWPICSAKEWGLSKIRFYLPAPLNIKHPAKVLVETNCPAIEKYRIVGAYNHERKGPLVVISDYEVFWNMTSDAGIREGDNTDFILRLFGFLSGMDGSLKHEPYHHTYKREWGKGTKTALFVTSGMGCFPDGSVNGLDTFADFLNQNGYRILIGPDTLSHLGSNKTISHSSIDLAIIAVPITTFEVPSEIAAAKNLLLIADGRTDILTLPGLKKSTEKLINIPKQYPYPINRMAIAHGIRFKPVTLLDSATSQMTISAKWMKTYQSLWLFRSSVIEILPNHDNIDIIATAGEYGTPVKALIKPVAINDHNPRRIPEKLANTEERIKPVLVKSPKIMAVGDLELLSNQGLSTIYGKRMLEEVLLWLNLK